MVSWGREYIGPHTWNGMLFFDMVVASISPVLVFHLVLCVCYDRLPLKGVGTLRLGVGVGVKVPVLDCILSLPVVVGYHKLGYISNRE